MSIFVLTFSFLHTQTHTQTQTNTYKHTRIHTLTTQAEIERLKALLQEGGRMDGGSGGGSTVHSAVPGVSSDTSELQDLLVAALKSRDAAEEAKVRHRANVCSNFCIIMQ